MSVCQIEERIAGRSYPRTCPTCRLGTCAKGLDQKQLIARIEALRTQLAERDRALAEWAEVSQRNYQRAKEAEERLAEARAGLAEVVRIVPRHVAADAARATLAKIGGGE
jgi:hypothetical protein